MWGWFILATELYKLENIVILGKYEIEYENIGLVNEKNLIHLEL